MQYDVVIVGAGPAGLSAACRLKQLNPGLSVCIIEKGSEVGAHILSGAVLEPTALNELFPDWKSEHAPLTTPVTQDEILWLGSASQSRRIPSWAAPRTMHNTGNYIVSLANLCRWLGEKAEELGVDIFPGFPAADMLYDQDSQRVKGVVTGDMGVSKEGSPKDSYTPGINLEATYTLFAEGCRGHLGKTLIHHFNLDQDRDPQHYGLGIKELWKIPPEKHRPGLVVHTTGWPLAEHGATGGGFLYHLDDNLVAVGLITDLSYDNPFLSPFEEFQRFKTHAAICSHLESGERISYGARAISKGGLQSLPDMTFPGGILIGDDAGTLNFAKIKGTHTAMKSGMIAADCIVDAFRQDSPPPHLPHFAQAYRESWAWRELQEARNMGPAIHKFGSFWGGVYTFLDLNIFRGRLPWTLSDPIPDHQTLCSVDKASHIRYSKPDGKLTFDKLSSVYLSNTNHEEDQPCHLKLLSPEIPVQDNLPRYDEPAQRYCPAGVYEIIHDNGQPRFQINAQNCVHCKTCDIKDPAQNIIWLAPEGGGGPNYPNM